MDRDHNKHIFYQRKESDGKCEYEKEYISKNTDEQLIFAANQYDHNIKVNMEFANKKIYSQNDYLCIKNESFYNPIMNNIAIEHQMYQNISNNYKKQEKDALIYEYYSSIEGELFICGIRGCNKRYRTKNGIIYHRKIGCKFEDSDKRFICKYEGCNSKYRGPSGLRYHLIHFHNEIPEKRKD